VSLDVTFWTFAQLTDEGLNWSGAHVPRPASQQLLQPAPPPTRPLDQQCYFRTLPILDGLMQLLAAQLAGLIATQ